MLFPVSNAYEVVRRLSEKGRIAVVAERPGERPFQSGSRAPAFGTIVVRTRTSVLWQIRKCDR